MKKLLIIINSYFNLIKEYFNFIDYEKRKTFKRRLDICATCSFRKHNMFFYTCSICGCLLRAKTKAYYVLDDKGKTIDGCPMRYW